MGDGVLGLGIMVELYNNFSTSASAIQNSMAGLTSQSQTMASTMQNAMMNMQNAMGGLVAGVALASPFGMAINSARNFEQQLSNIKSLGVLQKDMANVEKLAMEMGAKTKFSALEAAQGMEELLKAGVQMPAIMGKDGLSGALDLAVAGGLKLADAAEIASNALNAFEKDGLSIRQAGDILAGAANASATDVMSLKFSLSAVATAAAPVGLSFRDVSSALALFANNTLKGQDAGTSLKTMLSNLQPRTKEQIATFQQLGLITAQGANAFFDAKGKIKSMADIAGVLNTKLKHLTPQQRAFAIETMFGSDALRAGNILVEKGAEGINKMQAEMTKFTAAQVAKERLNNFNGAVEMLMGSIDTIMIKVGQLFLPTMTQFTKVIGTVVDAFEKVIDTDIGKYMVLGAAGATSFIVVFGAIIPFLQTTVTVMRTLAIVAGQTAIAFAPYIAIGGAIFFAFKSFASFKDVLEGTTKPAQGLLGFMQKLGAVIWTVGQVLSTWDGKTFDFGGNEAQMKALGIFDTLVSVATYTVRVIETVKGVGTAFYEAFSFVSSIVMPIINAVASGLAYIGRLFGMQDAKLKPATTALENWQKAGKILGYTVMAVMVPTMYSLIASAVSATVAFGAMAVSMAVAFAPFIAIGAVLAGVIATFYYWDDITKAVGNTWNWLTASISKSLANIYAGFSAVSTLFGAMVSNWWNQISAFGSWLYNSVSTFFVNAFNYAVESVYMVLVNGFNAYVGFLQGFGEWLVVQVPNFFMGAFSYAISGVMTLFEGTTTLFTSIGENIMNAIWNGLKSIWNSVSEWWNSVMASLGLGELEAKVSTLQATQDRVRQSGSNNGVLASDMQAKFAMVQAEKEKAVAQSVANNNTQNFNGAQNVTLAINLDGQEITKAVNLQNAMSESRR